MKPFLSFPFLSLLLLQCSILFSNEIETLENQAREGRDLAILALLKDSKSSSTVSPNNTTRVIRSTNQTIGTGTFIAISFDLEIANTAGYWNNSNPTRLTAPSTGYYNLTCTVAFSPNATGDRAVGIQAPHAGQFAVSRVQAVTTGSVTSITTSAVHRFNTGQYAECYGAQSSGGNLDIYSSKAAGNTSYSPSFQMTFLTD
ncbi:MAG: hypothetical protein HS115_11445 [Spirochaetales bacterium]|nr:hypothetical protein [Spirochaetales bacterium]